MSLAPLLNASPTIQIHAFAAMAAVVLGAVQLAAPKGTLPHRTVGWIWVSLMAAICISSFFIHTIRLWGPWSPIHLLSIFTLATLPVAVWRAHRHDVALSRRAGHRRPVYILAGPYHACSSVRLAVCGLSAHLLETRAISCKPG